MFSLSSPSSILPQRTNFPKQYFLGCPPWSRTYDFPSYSLYDRMCGHLPGVKGLSSSGSKYLSNSLLLLVHFSLPLLDPKRFCAHSHLCFMKTYISSPLYPSFTPFSRLWSNGTDSMKHSLATAAHISFTPTFLGKIFKPIIKVEGAA